MIETVDPDPLRAYLKKRGYHDALIGLALFQLEKAANDTTKSLYDCNRAVYALLRYGVKVTHARRQRFTPTRVGNTCGTPVNFLAVAIHPHV